MDYPRNLREFDRLFAHKEACLRFLEQVRWGNGFRCQACGDSRFWALSTGLRRCQSCRFKNSVKTGTIFESSRLPLKMWFYAIWWITSHKTGVSALDLQKDVGLGSYRSAWLLLHKIRNAMASNDFEPLSGEVEIGEALTGGLRPTKLLIAVEATGPKRVGRIRIVRAPSSSDGIGSFLAQFIKRGSTVRTSGGITVPILSHFHYRFQVSRERKAPLPLVQLVSDQLERWLQGTLHGRVEPKHLDSYLREFVFRFNYRLAKNRGLLFQRVIENAVRIEPSSYQAITAAK